MIFSDATLHEMTQDKPTSEFEMKLISGVGVRKYQLYGELFINEILNFQQSKNREAKKAENHSTKLTNITSKGFRLMKLPVSEK